MLCCSVGVVSGLRQLLEFGLFHGDPHPGNIFCLRDGRIAYVDFGNVAQLSNSNKQVRWQPASQAAALLDHFKTAGSTLQHMQIVLVHEWLQLA